MDQIFVWRITDPRYVQTAFSGEGARLWGGRFNSPGISAVYTSASLSLALLENLVQTSDRSLLRKKRLIKARVPKNLIYMPQIDELPEEWSSIPAKNASRIFGDAWITHQKSAVLRVPSVVVPLEYNYVINPQHSQLSEIGIEPDQALPLDPRFFT